MAYDNSRCARMQHERRLDLRQAPAMKASSDLSARQAARQPVGAEEDEDLHAVVAEVRRTAG